MSGKKDLNERTQVIFKALVEHYIQEGQPIGSKALAEDPRLSLSSASIRHVLSDLEAQGYLHSPHTSSGRIPTAKGYRLFVDSLLTVQDLSKQEVNNVRSELDPHLGTTNLLAVASSLISNITSLTGIVTIPKQKNVLLSHLEFLPLSGNKVLVVLVFNGNEVQNRIIDTSRMYSASELQQISNYLNAHFAGQELSKLKNALRKKMQEDKRDINQLLKAAIESDKPREDFLLSGQSHLLNVTDVADMGRLRDLFDAFHQKHEILHLLDQCLAASGVQIYIGKESGYSLLDDYSVVSASYSIDDQVVGALAVIGPTRMSYDRVIPIVDITAKLLSAALSQK